MNFAKIALFLTFVLHPRYSIADNYNEFEICA